MILKANAFIRPPANRTHDARALGVALEAVESKLFTRLRTIYNRLAQFLFTKPAKDPESIKTALLNETTVVFAKVGRAAVYTAGEHNATTKYLLLIPAARTRGTAHELMHLGALLNGNPARGIYGPILHELAVMGATTPEILFIGAVISGGVAAGVLKYGELEGETEENDARP